jgi:predicted RNA-binding protein associated with RNAse of E/G family
LYLDVVVSPNGEIALLDEDELKEALNKGIIIMDEYNMAYNVAENIIKEVEKNKEKIINLTYKYLNYLIKF